MRRSGIEQIPPFVIQQDMPPLMDTAAQVRLRNYFERIGDVIGNDARRASFAIYAMGILGDAERKSIEPIVARACPNPDDMEAAHQRLLHFTVDSPWSDHDVRLEAARYALGPMMARGPIEAWILDDTGFLKQGTHSVGVQRQYTGTAGKVANCQTAPSLSIATRTEQLPIDFALYLPKSWTESPARRHEARIPWNVSFATKPELGLQLVRRALADGIPPGVVLADQAYGASEDFRDGLDELKLPYAVGINAQTKVMVFDKLGRRRDERVSVKQLALRIEANGGFRRCTWRQGTERDLSARFALRRVVWAGKPGRDNSAVDGRTPVWLLIEWRDGEVEPANYFFCSLPADQMTRKKLVRIVMQRWRTERAYEDLKGELGLDHYEGRRFPGWHHHVSVVLACYAFVVAERARHFSLTTRRPLADDAQPIAA
jgi:SRSO17 transposase